MSLSNVLNLGNDFILSTFDDVKNHILYKKYATRNEIDTLVLSDTLIEHLDMSQIPANIKNITSTNGGLVQLSWVNSRPYGVLIFDKNEFSDFNAVDGTLICETLILDKNHLKTPKFENFKCNKLSLKHNFITVPTFFNSCIEHLDLSHNMMEYIINLPNSMVILDLSHNNLKEITQIFPETLTHLNLSHNKLTSVVHLPSNLLYLDISYNYFTNTSNIFNVLPKMLKTLDVSNCYIKEPENMFVSFEGKINCSNTKDPADISKSIIISDNSDDEFDNITFTDEMTNDDFNHDHDHDRDHSHDPFINRNFSFFDRNEDFAEMYGYGINKRKNAQLLTKTSPNIHVPVEVKQYSKKTSIIPRWEIQL